MKKNKMFILRIIIFLIVAIGFTSATLFLLSLNSESEISGSYYYLISYVSLFAFAVWYAITLYRLYDGNIKFLTLIIFCLGIFWLLDSLIMWMSDSITFSRLFLISFLFYVLRISFSKKEG